MSLATRHSLLKDADRCVMCGLCLPHCPTYTLTQDEGESPRGRIALIKALAGGELECTPRLTAHLDHCLACRSCEAVCPAGVHYGELIDGARALIPPTPERRALAWVTDPTRRGWAGRALRLYQRSGIQRLVRASGVLRRLGLERADRLLPPLSTPRPFWDYYPPRGPERGRIALFTGCIAELVDRATLEAAIRVLVRLGYGVHVPTTQACCGALHLHNGDPVTAEQLAMRNVAAFGDLGVEAVISIASGCGATLAEYEVPLPPVSDISTFITDVPWPEDLVLRPLPRRVAVQDPCTLRNVLRQADRPYALLRRIPELDLVPLPANNRCCGAAGSYMLTQPEFAERLRADKIEALRDLDVGTLVTSNIGCALHLRAGIAAAGLNIAVVHPVTLLAEQMPD